MGAVISGIDAARSVNDSVTGTLYPPFLGLLDNNKLWAPISILFLIAAFLLSKGLAVFAFVLVFIFTIIRYFIYSFVFNWQSLVIIIIIIIIIWVVAIIWGMVRMGVNQGILPGIIFLVRNIINPIIRLFKKLLKMVGAKLPFDEIDEDSLSEGMPTLLSIAMMVLKPLIEMILSPLRANREDESSQKCKSE